MTEIESIASTYADVKGRLATAEAQIREIEGKTAALQNERNEARAELQRLLDLEQADHVARILDGESAAAKKPKRLTRIGNLNEQIAGIGLALPIQEKKLADARANRDQIRAEIGGAVLPPILRMKAEAFQACAEPLSQLLHALVEVAAIDDLQASFAGSQGRIILEEGMNVSQLFSARKILERFKSNLPPRFAALAIADLEAANDRIAERAETFRKQIGA